MGYGFVRRRAPAAIVAGAMLASLVVLCSRSFCFFSPVLLGKANGRSFPALRGFLSHQRQAPETEHAHFSAASLAGLSASAAGLMITVSCLRSRHQDAGAQRRHCGQGARSAVVRAAASNEEKLLQLVDEFPQNFDQDDMFEVMQALKKLPGAPGDAFEQLVGSWKGEWDSDAGNIWPKSAGPPLKLKFRSLDALPPVPVQFIGKYSRVLDVRESPTQPLGGVFEAIEVFTVPGSGAEAALVLSGPWKTGTSEGEWGKGAPRTRCGVEFQSVRLAPSTANPEASTAMLEEAGLKDYLKAVDVAASASYVDIQFINGEMRVDKTESGVEQVYTRMSEDIPFTLD